MKAKKRPLTRRIFLVLIVLFIMPMVVRAEKITVVYTGNSYASLYPCGHCPSSVGGGVSRRAAVIDDIRKNTPNAIVLDAGDFTAGGPLDEASQNPTLDKTRSLFYYQALAKIGYDALGVGEAEFNFGSQFLEEGAKKNNLRLVSSNLKLGRVLPHYIHEFKSAGSKFKVAVIGLTPLDAHKKAGVAVDEYEPALTTTLADLKGKASFVILLSSLGDEQNALLAGEFPGINVIISSGPMMAAAPAIKVNDTLVLATAFRGREVGVIEIDAAGGTIKDWALKSRKLSLDVAEDIAVKKMIPACFQDADCPRKEGLMSRCQQPAEQNSMCGYFEATKIDATVITDTQCPTCITASTEQALKNIFLGINFTKLDYRTPEAAALIKQHNVKFLPYFIIPEAIKAEKSFEQVSKFFEEKQGSLTVRRELGGLFLFLERKEVKGALDYFVSIQDKSAGAVLKPLLEFARKNNIPVAIHFVVSKAPEAESLRSETKLALAIKKLYPTKFNEYLTQRLENIDNLYWVEILDNLGIDYKKVKELSRSRDADILMRENTKLAEELGVTDSNVFLINNQKIFKIFKIDADELLKLLS
ncbi:MAG: hypothetical protein ABH865_07110 [Candidatus Omnitrophota bacterium]|nr:hypothetical protein [Candidatus Omnitrophota bacterium]